MAKGTKKMELIINEAARESLTARFEKVNNLVYANFKRDTWKLAHTALAITKDRQFKSAFKNDKDFAEAVGYTAGALSKLITSAKMDVEFGLNSEYGLTTGQAQELIPLYRFQTDDGNNGIHSFLKSHEEEDLSTLSTKIIREYVHDELYLLNAIPMDDSKSDNNQLEDTSSVLDTDGDDTPDTSIASDDVPTSSTEILETIAGIIVECESQGDNKSILGAYNAIKDLLESEGLL